MKIILVVVFLALCFARSETLPCVPDCTTVRCANPNCTFGEPILPPCGCCNVCIQVPGKICGQLSGNCGTNLQCCLTNLPNSQTKPSFGICFDNSLPCPILDPIIRIE